MSSVIKSVAYSYIDGYRKPFSFDVVCVENGKVTLDIHKKFATKEEFFDEIEGVIPLFLEGGDPVYPGETASEEKQERLEV